MTGTLGVNVSLRRIADVFSELHGAHSLLNAIITSVSSPRSLVLTAVFLVFSLTLCPRWSRHLELTSDCNNGSSVVLLAPEPPHKTLVHVESLCQDPRVEAAEYVVALLVTAKTFLLPLLLELLMWVTSQMEFLYPKMKFIVRSDYFINYKSWRVNC